MKSSLYYYYDDYYSYSFCLFVVVLFNSSYLLFAFSPVIITTPPKLISTTTTTTTTTTTSLFQHAAAAAAAAAAIPKEEEEVLLLSTGLSKEQEQEMNDILTEALERMSFFMDTDCFKEDPNLRDMFQPCWDAVQIQPSSIPGAGRGLFATQDIPKGTIVSFYPVHSVGVKYLDTGACQSVQMISNDDPDDHFMNVEHSGYALFSMRPHNVLCGVDLEQHFETNVQIYVDMNPALSLVPGWYGGLMNDGAAAAIVDNVDNGDETYYPKSRNKQNVELVPFGPAPFHVGVTTRDVLEGQELFVSYGYNYWASSSSSSSSSTTTNFGKINKSPVIRQQEWQASIDTIKAIQLVHERYSNEAQYLAQIFASMGGEDEPIEDLAFFTTATTTDSCSTSSPRRRRRRHGRTILLSKRSMMWRNFAQRLFGQKVSNMSRILLRQRRRRRRQGEGGGRANA